MAYKEITTNIAKFEKPEDNVEGTYKGTEAGTYGDNYLLETSNGEVLTIFGKTVLNTKMKKVNIGQKIRITYKGEVKGENGRTYSDYKIEIDQ